MKKILFYIATVVAIAFAFSACQKLTNSETESSTIVCRTPSETKSYADGINVLWQNEDIIYVIDQDDPQTYYTYTLNSGAGTREATFTGSGIDAGKDIIALHVAPYTGGFHLNSKYYFDTPAAPTLFGYGAGTPASDQARRIPMMARGKMGEPLEFTHLASMIRISLTNSLGSNATITRISLIVDSGDISSRFEVNPADDFSVSNYGASGQSNIQSDGSVTINNGDTKTFDFIVTPRAYSNFNLRITTSENKTYSYKKTSLTTLTGTIHKFNTTLNSAAQMTEDFLLSIDGHTDVEYSLSSNLPETPGTSVALKPNGKSTITAAEFDKLLGYLPAGEVIALDLSLLDYTQTDWNKGINDKVGDFYLPKNITRITGYFRFSTGSNCKLHIPKNITFIAFCAFTNPAKKRIMNAGCGYFVAGDHESFSSDKGILYSKDTKTLIDRPAFVSDVDGIVIEDGVQVIKGYALSNENYPSVVFPASLTRLENSNVLYETPQLATVTFKSVTPPEGAQYGYGGAATGVVIINTGDPATDITSKELYIVAMGTKTGWTIKTLAESI